MISRIITGAVAMAAAGSLVVGCASMGFSVNKEKLVATASFDHSCPQGQVKVLTVDDDGSQGTGRYLLDVCGKQKQYKRAGTLYYDAEKGSPLDQ